MIIIRKKFPTVEMTLISFMIFSEGNKKTKKPKEKLQLVRKEKERGPNNHSNDGRRPLKEVGFFLPREEEELLSLKERSTNYNLIYIYIYIYTHTTRCNFNPSFFCSSLFVLSKKKKKTLLV
jgi:hypothetical protein